MKRTDKEKEVERKLKGTVDNVAVGFEGEVLELEGVEALEGLLLDRADNLVARVDYDARGGDFAKEILLPIRKDFNSNTSHGKEEGKDKGQEEGQGNGYER